MTSGPAGPGARPGAGDVAVRPANAGRAVGNAATPGRPAHRDDDRRSPGPGRSARHRPRPGAASAPAAARREAHVPSTTGPPRLLVLRALGLGDLLAAVPALRGLRRTYPDHEVVLAAPARLADVAAATGVVDRLLPAEAPRRGVPARLDWRGPPPELAVDLHGNGSDSRLPLYALRPRRLFGYRCAVDAALGPSWRADEHERARWCRLLTWYGVPADPGEVRLPVPGRPSPAPGAVVLHPGADAGARRWPAGRFAAVARALREAGRPVVVTAGFGEADLARYVADRAGLPPRSVFGGTADVPFEVLTALVAHARAVVVGDTGLAHLATALGAPSVVLFGPVAPRLWGPPRSRLHRVLWHPDSDRCRPGDPHGDRPDPRLLRVTVPEVLRAVAELPTNRPRRTRGAVR